MPHIVKPHSRYSFDKLIVLFFASPQNTKKKQFEFSVRMLFVVFSPAPFVPRPSVSIHHHSHSKCHEKMGKDKFKKSAGMQFTIHFMQVLVSHPFLSTTGASLFLILFFFSNNLFVFRSIFSLFNIVFV